MQSIVDIGSLISSGKRLVTAQLDPANDYVIVQKFTGLSSKRKGDFKAYSTFAVPLSEVLGGGNPPGGNNTEIQFNDNGAFGASANLIWNGTALIAKNAAAPPIISRADAGSHIELQSTAGVVYGAIGADASNVFQVYDNDLVTVPFYITSAGLGYFNTSLKVGTTSTNSRVSFKGTTSDATARVFELFDSSDTSLLNARNDGNIGIGNIAPLTKLHIYQSDGSGSVAGTTPLFVESAGLVSLIRYINSGYTGQAGFDSTGTFFIGSTAYNWVQSLKGVTTIQNDDQYSYIKLVSTNATSSFGPRFTQPFQIYNELTSKFMFSIDADGDTNLNQDEGNTGIGIAPIARLHVFGVSASGVNQRLEPVTGVKEDANGATVNTTDATTTTIQTVAIPADTGLLITTVVNCRKTAGAGIGVTGSTNTYIRTVKAKNIGGTVTIGTVQSDYTFEDIAPGFNTTLSVSGTNVLIRVVGAVNDDVTWNCITKTYNI